MPLGEIGIGVVVAGVSLSAPNTWQSDQTFKDNVKLILGDSAEGSSLYFDGVDTIFNLRENGSGDLMIALAGGFPSPDPNAVHIWKASAGTVTATSSATLILESDGTNYLTLLEPATAVGGIRTSSPTTNDVGILEYRHVSATPASTWQTYINNSLRLNYASQAFAFQEATAISTTAGDLTLDPTSDVVLGSGVALKAGKNNGTANTGVTAVEYGDGYQHVTVLTVSQTDALTLADNTAIADGYLLYTFPAGVIIVDYTYMSMAVTAGSSDLQSDTPDVGIGSVIATGGVSVLGGTPTFEDYIDGQTADDANGTEEVKTLIPGGTSITDAGAIPFIIEASGGAARAVHFNVAATWSDDMQGDLTADISGTVVLVWRFLA